MVVSVKSNDAVRMRLEAVEGLLRLHERWNEVSETVASARDRHDAVAKLREQPFGFSDLQAEHILDCRIGLRTELGRRQLLDERQALLDQLDS